MQCVTCCICGDEIYYQVKQAIKSTGVVFLYKKIYDSCGWHLKLAGLVKRKSLCTRHMNELG